MKPTELRKCIREDEAKKKRWSYEDIAIAGGSSCEHSVVLKASSTCTNEPTVEDFCVGHVPFGNGDWELIC